MLWNVLEKKSVLVLNDSAKHARLTTVGFARDDRDVWLAYSDGSLSVVPVASPDKVRKIECGCRTVSAFLDPSESIIVFVEKKFRMYYKYDVKRKKRAY